MRILCLAVALAGATAGCEPAPQPQPNEMEQVVNATLVDPGVVANDGTRYPEGNITPAERNNVGNALRAQDQPSAGNSQ